MKKLNSAIKKLKAKFKNNVKVNIPLKNLTSFKIGGKAKCVVFVESLEHIFFTLKVVEEFKVPYFVMGNGTNVLASDAGFNGIILKFGKDFSDVEIRGTEVVAYAGASLNKLCACAKLQGLSGLENLFGIPASVGGACYMNAGAHGTEFGQFVKNAYVFENGKVKILNNEQLEFSYRHSVLQEFNNPVVIMVELELIPGNIKQIENRMIEVMNSRKISQPLEFPSAGSIFKKMDNMIVSKLLDKKGLKGYNVNNAEVSLKHAGFIINKGNATAKDVALLIHEIKTKIKNDCNINLQEEIVYLGEFNDITR